MYTFSRVWSQIFSRWMYRILSNLLLSLGFLHNSKIQKVIVSESFFFRLFLNFLTYKNLISFRIWNTHTWISPIRSESSWLQASGDLRRRTNVKRAHAPFDAASQLMRGDVTKTKPCALDGARDRERNRAKLFGEGNGPRTVRGHGKVRLGSTVTRIDSRRRFPSQSSRVLRMPFISKDWRSPGEEWVKTVEGWEKKKILECANNKTLSLLLR